MNKGLVRSFLLLFGKMLNHDNNPKILFYHDIGKRYTDMGTEPKIFWAQMEMIRGLKHKICFDDGFRGIWDEREKFRDNGIQPTVFLAVRLIGQVGYLNWDEIRILERDYQFIFQCHTWSHQTLIGPMIDESPKEKRDEDWYKRELVESKKEIERQLGHEVTELCFPVGYFSTDIIERCQNAGYHRLYSSVPGNQGEGVCGKWRGFVEPRCLCQFLSLFEFGCVINGGLNFFDRRYFRKHFINR